MLQRTWRGGKIDLNSLQVRLTLGIAAVSVLGIGGVALWTSWKMQQQLLATHKQSLQYIAERFPRDVAHYSEMRSPETGLQTAINHLSIGNLLIWVKRPDGAIAAQSMALMGRADQTATQLMTLPDRQIPPQLMRLNDRYFLWCSGSLSVKGMEIGQLYLVQDITNDQKMLVQVIRSLTLASLAAIFIITLAIALYVQRSLQPLRQLSQIAGTISADDLGNAHIQIDRAPSEVKELAQTCNMMLDRLSQSWEQQRQFVSNVSHELRTPLTIVSGYLQSTLRRGNNLTEIQRDALEIAAGEADRTIQLLQDLLDLARADSGYLHFHLEGVILNDLVAEVAGMAQQYSNRPIEIQAKLNAIALRADRNRLKQVLLNLIDNAVKYSEPDQPITIKLQQIGEIATIEVCDRGVGIPLPQQARIFERFYRCDEARSRSTGGTGLGLAIVKTLVTGMGGSVSVISKLGAGSVFSVTLPAMADPEILSKN